MTNRNKYVNDVVLYRERLGLTRLHTARLLGLRDTTILSRIERGHHLPNLKTALKLAALYRVPVEFLYPGLYKAYREDIRQREARLFDPLKGNLNLSRPT